MALLWAILLVVVPVFLRDGASVFLVAIEERRHRRVRRKGDGSSKENKNRKEYAGEKPALEAVRLWYEDYGKRRLDRLVDELKREGIHLYGSGLTEFAMWVLQKVIVAGRFFQIIRSNTRMNWRDGSAGITLR